MNYELNYLKEKILEPIHLQSIKNKVILKDNKFSNFPIIKLVDATNEMIERSTRIYKKPPFHLDSVEVIIGCKKKQCSVNEKIVLDLNFCNLIKFERIYDNKSLNNDQPNVLIVAPLSGHFATLLRDTVKAFLPDHNVWITDWKDARGINVEKGEFSLDTYVDYLLDFLKIFSGNVHVIAVCQPVVPVSAAVSFIEENNLGYQPKSITLMGGPVDASINPGIVNKFAIDHDLAWFKKYFIAKVPNNYPGSGRLVCPGYIMLNGFISLNTERHKKAAYDHFMNLILDKENLVTKHRDFYDEYLAVLDMPAEYYLQCISKVFQTFDLPRGNMKYRGNTINMKAIEKTALLTVEGEHDDISCPGQTYAAYDLCKNLKKSKKQAYLQKDVGHYGIFSGRRWREFIKPKISKFIKKHN